MNIEGANGIMYNGIFIPLEKIGIDVSDTTATAEDVLEGKQFYNAEGNLTQGTYVPAPSGGFAEYFKCVAVGEKAEEGGSGDSPSSGSSTDIIVSGALPDIINGLYTLLVPEATGRNRIWQKEVENGYIWIDAASSEWLIRFYTEEDTFVYYYATSNDYDNPVDIPSWGAYRGDASAIPVLAWASSSSAGDSSSSELPEPVFSAPLTAQSATAETGQSLTTTGTVTFQEVDGRQCAYFDGSSYIQFSDANLPSGSADRTLACWMKQISNNGWGHAFGYGSNQQYGKFCLGVNSSGYIAFTQYGGELVSNVSDVNVWHHVVVVQNSSGQQIYIDGTLATSGSLSVETVLGNGYLGAAPGLNSSENFNGYIADAQIYNTVLTAEQITELYQSTNNPLVFHAPLTAQSATAETGQALTYNGNIQFTEIDGRQCAYFEGSSSTYIKTPDTNLPYGSSDRTFSIWFYAKAHTVSSYEDAALIVYGYPSGTGTNINLAIDETGVMKYDTWNSSTRGSTTIELNKWYHCSCVFKNKQLTAYLNGVQDAQWNADYLNTEKGDGYCYIGIRQSGTYYFNGYISDVQIYNTALTADEIMKLYDPDYAPLLPNTWNGQKALLLTDEETGKPYYEFEETVTEGLTFGNGFTPVVDGIYDREALVKVSALVEKQGLGTVFAVQENSETSSTIVQCKITSSDSGTIDWGDGNTTNISSGTDVAYSHDYGDSFAVEHIVTIEGSAITKIDCGVNSNSSYRNAITRLIRLGDTLTNMNSMFNSCYGLTRIEDNVQIPAGVTDMEAAFAYSNYLNYAPASLRLPANCTNFGRAFYLWGASTDISHWFDNLANAPSGASINIEQAFKGSKCTGTVPADLLWNNPRITWSNTWMCFDNASSIANYSDIPSSWRDN